MDLVLHFKTEPSLQPNSAGADLLFVSVIAVERFCNFVFKQVPPAIERAGHEKKLYLEEGKLVDYFTVDTFVK